MLINQIQNSLTAYESVTFNHHTRAGNKLADFLSNHATDKNQFAPSISGLEQHLSQDLKAFRKRNTIPEQINERITTATTKFADISAEYVPLSYQGKLKINLIGSILTRS